MFKKVSAFKNSSPFKNIMIISMIFSLTIIILGTWLFEVNHALYSVSFIIFIVLMNFIDPLETYVSNNKQDGFSLEGRIIFSFHGANIIVLCSTFYLIFLSDNCELNLSYYFFPFSVLVLMAFLKLIKLKTRDITEDSKDENNNKKIGNRIFIGLWIFLVLKNIIAPTIYTISGEEDLNEVESPEKIFAYFKTKEKNDMRTELEAKINDSQLIDGIVNQINQNKTQSLKGVKALNQIKRSLKLPHYKLGYFRNPDFDGLSDVKIYLDGYICIKKSRFGSLWINYYHKYYDLELLPETTEKVISIIKEQNKAP